MIIKEDIIADMHTHTVASLHGYSTVYENICFAEKAGMKYIAITDHVYQNGDYIFQKNEVTRVKYMEDNVNRHVPVKVIGSAEFNILQTAPMLERLKKIKWRPIGLHNFNLGIEALSWDELYEGFEKAAEDHNAFCHIERELEKINREESKDGMGQNDRIFLEKIVELAKKKDIYLELNECSLIPSRANLERLRYWFKIASENGNKISLGSDAHFCAEVGLFDRALALLNEVNYDKNLILNCDEERVASLLLH